jgi:hypothetical protein
VRGPIIVTITGTEIEDDINRQIERIIKKAGTEKGIPIGALTSDNRDRWAEVGSPFCWHAPQYVTVRSLRLGRPWLLSHR